VGRTLRLLAAGAPDLRDLLLAKPDGRKLDGGLGDSLGPSTDIEVVLIGARGWAGTLEELAGDTEEHEGPQVVITSVSSEISDPSAEPAERLIELARAVEARGGRVVVLNGSTLVPGDPGRDGEPLDLRIRRLNLAAMEASHATGLSVLDADRLIAESPLPRKVVGPFDYSPEMCEALRSGLISILDELGFAAHSVRQARVPYVRKATDLAVARWLKTEGEAVAPDDVLCELRLEGMRMMTRPTSAVVLASVGARKPAIRRLVSRDRVRRRASDVVVSLVARDTAVLRRILRPEGASVRSGDGLALLTREPDTPLDASSRPELFRAVLHTDDPVVESQL
jgi:hypothetical protein